MRLAAKVRHGRNRAENPAAYGPLVRLDVDISPPLILDHPAFRRAWYPVAHADELAMGPIERSLLGEELVVWSPAPGIVSAARNRCPHRDARLSDGWLDSCNLVCPYHGWGFGEDGRAAHIPQLPEGSAIPPKAALVTYRAAERYGWVWVALDEPVRPIPEIPEFDDPAWRLVREPESLWECSAVLLVDNNIDPAHIAYVHRDSFGSPDHPEVPLPELELGDDGMRVRYELAVQGRPGEVSATVRVTDNHLVGPLLLVLRITYPDGLQHLMVKACTPETATRTRQVQMVLRNDTEADRPAQDIVAFDAKVWEEDRKVLERCWSDYRVDLVDNVHLKTDRASIDYRRWLRRITDGEWPTATVTTS